MPITACSTVDLLILEREGNCNARRTILVARQRSTIDTRLAHEGTTPDVFSGEKHNALQGQTIFM